MIRLIKLDADDDGNVLIEGPGGATVKFDADEQTEVLKFITDGCCAVCLSEIPQESTLCCTCLNDVFRYHEAHHLCIETRR